MTSPTARISLGTYSHMQMKKTLVFKATDRMTVFKGLTKHVKQTNAQNKIRNKSWLLLASY